ncbi:MAG: hypothetical protein LC723_06735 [Actinobacteria bacterium]|nr:hypothetical protein [Actinomycetota bacterium]
MSEETTTTETETSTETGTTTTAEISTETSTTEETVFDKAYVEGLRKEAAEWRTKLRAQEEAQAKLTAQLAEIEKAKLSDQERLKLEWEEAKEGWKKSQAQLQESFLESAVAKNVKNFELVDVDATLRLLDANSVEYGDDGRPTNIDTVLTTTLEKFPFLKAAPKRAPDVDPGTTNPGRPKGKPVLTRELIAKMSQSEISSRRDEINAWMANGYK